MVILWLKGVGVRDCKIARLQGMAAFFLLLSIASHVAGKPTFKVGVCMTRTWWNLPAFIQVAINIGQSGAVMPLEGANYTGGELQDFDVEYIWMEHGSNAGVAQVCFDENCVCVCVCVCMCGRQSCAYSAPRLLTSPHVLTSSPHLLPPNVGMCARRGGHFFM